MRRAHDPLPNRAAEHKDDGFMEMAALRTMHIASRATQVMLTNFGDVDDSLKLSSAPRFQRNDLLALLRQLICNSCMLLCRARAMHSAVCARIQRKAVA